MVALPAFSNETAKIMAAFQVSVISHPWSTEVGAQRLYDMYHTVAFDSQESSLSHLQGLTAHAPIFAGSSWLAFSDVLGHCTNNGSKH
jgi:hypothetical protein